jgi:uncharacterized protein
MNQELRASAVCLALAVGALLAGAASAVGDVWINELHYDNEGADAGEGVEIAGTSGTDLADYSLVFYNGGDSATYGTNLLSGTIDDERCGYGALWFAIASLQNGGSDAVALVRSGTGVVQFLSYEGTITAANGPAAGLASVDIGVIEDGSDSQGTSLQLAGTGTNFASFSWTGPDFASVGSLNSAQTITGCSNRPPVLAPVGDQSVTVGSNLTFAVTAADPVDGDLITLSSSFPPPGANFPPAMGAGSVSNDFVWPNPPFEGDFPVTFYAEDKDGVDNETILIHVLPAPATGLVARINEVEFNGPGSDTNDFVEIVAPSGVNLVSCYLAHYNGATNSDGEVFRFTFPSFVVPNDGIADTNDTPLGFAVLAVAGSDVANVDFVLPTDLQQGPDGLVLYDAAGNILDAVAWAGPGDLTEDDPGTVSTSLASTAAAYLHVTPGDTGNSTATVQAPNAVNADTGAGWMLEERTPGAINAGQTSSQIDLTGEGAPPTPTPPVLNPIGHQFALESNALVFAVTAAPTEGDSVTLSVSNAPAGSSFGATNEIGTFSWPSPAPVGVYTMTFYAVDDDGADQETITVTVDPAAVGAALWINELNYDPAGSPDTNEFIEVAGVAGTDLSLYTLVLYNGANGASYSNVALSGSVDDEGCGYGAVAVSFSTNGLQNGAPDGVALVRGASVVQFLSYEGPFTATNGPAANMLSASVGAQLADNDTLQLGGSGTNYSAFIWVTNAPSAGLLNVSQLIPSCGGGDADGDGMPDDWEIQKLGGTGSGAEDDDDVDGSKNLEEYIADTDPLDFTSYYPTAITNSTGRGVQTLRAGPPTSAERRYDIYWRTNLFDDAEWEPLGLNVPGLGPAQAVDLTVTNDAAFRIYRTGVRLP